MPVILGLETSTDVCSVALHDGKRVAQVVLQEPQAHAAKLASLIGQVLNESQTPYHALDAVAVSAGPGSYTGLRIGTSTAKGLCYALDIPLIAIGTLELLAYQGKELEGEGLLCPMIDARRMEVYCMVTDKALNVVEPVSARIIDGDSFSELLKDNRMLFYGNGAGKCRAVIGHANAVFVDGIFPSAASLVEMAQQRFRQAAFDDLVQFKPFYLKDFVAGKARSGN